MPSYYLPFSSECTAIFNNFREVRFLLRLIFHSTSALHTCTQTFQCYYSAFYCCWTAAKVSIQSIHICDRLSQAHGSYCNLCQTVLCWFGKFRRWPYFPRVYLPEKKQETAKVCSPHLCHCRHFERNVKLKGGIQMTCSLICIDLSFQPPLHLCTHNFRLIHNQVHTPACCAQEIKRCFDCIFKFKASSKAFSWLFVFFSWCSASSFFFLPPPLHNPTNWPAVSPFLSPKLPTKQHFFNTLFCQQGWFSVCAVVSNNTTDRTSVLSLGCKQF